MTSSGLNESVGALFAGPGEIRALCRSVDWNGGLGAWRGWSQNLEAAVRICLDSAAAMAVLIGPELRLLYNEAYLSLVDPAMHPRALGRPASEVWPESWEQLGHELQRLMERGESVLFDERERLSSGGSRGEKVVFAYTYAPIREEDGLIAGALVFVHPATSGRQHRRMAGIVQDITERKRAEKALRSSEEKFGKAFHGNTSGMAITRLRDGTLIEVNDSFLELMRLSREEVIGKTTVEVGIWKDPEVRARYIRQIEQHGMIRNSELRATRPTGEPWVGLLSSQLSELEGEPVMITSVVDITDQKLAELALERANARLLDADRRKDAFLAVLSHELRNPLAPITSSLYILEHAAPGGDQARRAREVIERQVAQLSRLVNDLLDMTRITSGKIQLQRQRVELNELARRALEDHRALFEKRAVDVELQPAPTDVFISADRNRIAQVIGNLLQNAAKFTSGGGHVSLAVSCDLQAMQAVIRVSDTGEGLSPDTLAHLFEPFRQADTSLDRSKGGLGLGLSLVKSLVEQHGGSVGATSAGVGKGADFVVRLPLELGAQATSEPARVAAGKVQRRVLVIEDNVDAAETLRDALELDGHEVAVAHDGPEGLAKAHEFHPNFVLCDIGLPGMDGYAVARAFRSDEALSQVHLVALSGYALPEDLERSAGAGFEQHVAKPLSFEKLESILSAAPLLPRVGTLPASAAAPGSR